MKWIHQPVSCLTKSRPRKGAWIEIMLVNRPAVVNGRPRKGAWIEITGKRL